MKRLFRKLVEMFPLRVMYGYDNHDEREVFVRNKTKTILLSALVLTFGMSLNGSWRAKPKEPFPVIVDSTIDVDRSLSFSQLVEANRLDYLAIETALKERTGDSGQYTARARLFPLKASTTGPYQLILDLDAEGYRPATEDELLTWGIKYPLEQQKYTIMTSNETKRGGADCRFLNIALFGADGTRGLKAVCAHFPYLHQRIFVLGVKK
jgi:hypothetical protein